mgnify:CR=1 FL=1
MSSGGQKIHIAAERLAGLIPAPGQEGDVVKFVAAGSVAPAHAAVQAQVEKRLAGKTPQGGNGSQSGTSMKSEIEKYMA